MVDSASDWLISNSGTVFLEIVCISCNDCVRRLMYHVPQYETLDRKLSVRNACDYQDCDFSL